MNIFLGIMILFSCSSTFALNEIQGLKPEDQKYYKNEYGTGMNQLERIDSTVKEINNIHGEMEKLKAEVNALKAEVESLKNKK